MISFELRIILVFLVAFFSAIFLLPKLSRIAERVGLLDHPNHRKVHSLPRPLVGGIGMVTATIFTSLLFIPIMGLRGYFLGLAVLLLVGFLDDFKEIGHRQKFLAQVVAVIVLIHFSQISLNSFGDIFGFGVINIPGGDIVIWLVTVFCVVGVINAVNLIDGLDGLAGGISFIAFIFFAIHASFAGESNLMLLNLALAGSILGFLWFNWYPSVLFMGDAGSLCLGFSLSFMALSLTQGESSAVSPITVLLVLALPITDTIIVMLKRILHGKSPFVADKYHVHHIFLRYGMGRDGAVRVILGLSVLMGCLSLLGPVLNVSDAWLFSAFCVCFLVYLASSFYIMGVFRYSLKVRKKRRDKISTSFVLRLIFGSFDIFGIFRKARRHNVNLKMAYQTDYLETAVNGQVLNISLTGCMARIDAIDCLGADDANLFITLPADETARQLPVDVEHLWCSEHEGSYYHGFRFRTLGPESEAILYEFLKKYGERGGVRVQEAHA
ncbi:PilZ domain-containing protein [Desulfosediminicola flagellatus]|uniref:PilZ domain-containing protein n=1 Tax=Desulfosediminicola flagellatus TaxID=2569541 RepID=UPI0010ACF5A2|nr:PilZ domain-containing protein [Desulfosediminicola flagellatus]